MNEGLELRDLVEIIKRHRKLIGYILCIAIMIALAINNVTPPTYEANVTMRVKYSRGGGNELIGTASPDELMRQQIYTYAEIVKSRAVIETVIDKEYGDAVNKPSYEELTKCIDVQAVNNTEILNVSVQLGSAEKTQKVANALVGAFNERLTEIVRLEGKEARVFLGERLAEAKSDLDKAEKALVEYKKSKETVSATSQTNLYLDRQSALIKQDTDNQLALAASRARTNAVSKQLSSQSPGVIADNSLIQQYKSRLADQEIELVGLRKTLTANHPKVAALQANIAETKSRLRAEIDKVVKLEAASSNPVHQTLLQNKAQAEGDLAVANAQKTALERLKEEGKKELLQLPAKEQGLARLMLDYSVREGAYTMLAKRYEEARISEATQPTNVQVVDMAALPEKPVKPRRLVNLAVAVLLGLFIGTSAAFMAEYFYKTIDTTEDVKRYLGINVIGSIPRYHAQQRKTTSWWKGLLNMLRPNGRRGKHSRRSRHG